MPETRYTTAIFLTVNHRDIQEAEEAALQVCQDFIGRLRRTAPEIRDLRLELDQPVARKGAGDAWTSWVNLKATVPHDFTSLGADDHRDAWRWLLKITFHEMCQRNHHLICHAGSHVAVTRELREVEKVVLPEPAKEKPKEMVTVKVLLEGEEHSVQISKGENLLDAVNEQGVDVKWDCKSGVCDTCKVLVLEGAENLGEPTEDEISMLEDLVGQGYRLSCQVSANGPCTIKQ